ncbi:MAG: EI24 domain-containing protein [Burkholderiaceae bacterium]|nr:EI24 domain-containing protein [Burkholderiaceae bacterium]
MQPVLTAFGRAIVSQLHPKMLALLVVPFVLAIVFWVITAWWLWAPITGWLQGWLFGGGWMSSLDAWAASHGFSGFAQWTVALLALLVVVPVMFASAVVIIAVFAMPMVIRHLGNGPYRDVAREGSMALAPSVWNAVSSTVLFAVGYLVTLPLWLIPPLALVVPWLWWSWLTARVMRFDSLVEHASAAERGASISERKRDYFLLALLVTLLNYVPPLFLITPVLSALAFAHYSLALLRRQRAAMEVRPAWASDSSS